VEAYLRARWLAGIAAVKQRELCRVEDVHEGAVRGFDPAAGGFTGLFALHRHGNVFAYVNSCPHLGSPREWTKGQFFSSDGSHIICAIHRAGLSIEDGRYLSGPCIGGRLEPIKIAIKAGIVLVPEAAGL
jgi:nitrite reductase/ring-hydroxylating ferredoxin subunit